MDTKTIDFYVVVELFFLLLIGIGPKIALVPFLDVTAGMDAATKGLVTQVTEIEREGRSVGVVASRSPIWTSPRVVARCETCQRGRFSATKHHLGQLTGLDDSRRERRLHAIRTMHLPEPRT